MLKIENAVAALTVFTFFLISIAKTDEQSEDCYHTCVTSADMSLWPTTPPADEDDEEPRCRGDIRYTADCIQQCEDLSIFSCIAEALQFAGVNKLKKMLQAVSTAKYCQGCTFLDNPACYLRPKVRQLLFKNSTTKHPYLAALSPFINGLYLMDHTACKSQSETLRDFLQRENALVDICEWLQCESISIMEAPGCNDVTQHMKAITRTLTGHLKCPSAKSNNLRRRR